MTEGEALPPEPPVPTQHVAEGELCCVGRNSEALAMEGRDQRNAQLAEYRVPAAGLRYPYLAKTELVAARRSYLSTQGPGHELSAQAHSEDRYTRGHGVCEEAALGTQRRVAVVGRLRTSERDDEVNFFQGRLIELVELGRALENVERSELEASFYKGRRIVFGQGFRLGVANNECELWHVDYRHCTRGCRRGRRERPHSSRGRNPTERASFGGDRGCV